MSIGIVIGIKDGKLTTNAKNNGAGLNEISMSIAALEYMKIQQIKLLDAIVMKKKRAGKRIK